MVELNAREIMAITNSLTKIETGLNDHVIQQTKDFTRMETTLDTIKIATTKNANLVAKHEERLDDNDVWRAGFLGHIKGIWFAVGALGTILGIALTWGRLF